MKLNSGTIYGIDGNVYKTKAELEEAFRAGKDFTVNSFGHPTMRGSIRNFEEGAVLEAYYGPRSDKIMTIKV